MNHTKYSVKIEDWEKFTEIFPVNSINPLSIGLLNADGRYKIVIRNDLFRYQECPFKYYLIWHPAKIYNPLRYCLPVKSDIDEGFYIALYTRKDISDTILQI